MEVDKAKDFAAQLLFNEVLAQNVRQVRSQRKSIGWIKRIEECFQQQWFFCRGNFHLEVCMGTADKGQCDGREGQRKKGQK
jgi:hypothetical protein